MPPKPPATKWTHGFTSQGCSESSGTSLRTEDDSSLANKVGWDTSNDLGWSWWSWLSLEQHWLARSLGSGLLSGVLLDSVQELLSALGVFDVLDSNVQSFLNVSVSNNLVDNHTNGALGHVKDDTSLSVVVFVWHTLLDGSVDLDVDDVSDLVGLEVHGHRQRSVLLEVTTESVTSSGSQTMTHESYAWHITSNCTNATLLPANLYFPIIYLLVVFLSLLGIATSRSLRLSLVSTWSSSTVWRSWSEVNVLLRVQSDHEGWDGHNLLSHSNVSLGDQDPSVVNGLGKTKLENLGLQSSLKEVLNLQGQNVIQLHLVFWQDTDSDQSSDQGVTLEKSLLILLVSGKQVSGSSSDLGQLETNSVDFVLVLQTVFTGEFQLGIQSGGLRPHVSHELDLGGDLFNLVVRQFQVQLFHTALDSVPPGQPVGEVDVSREAKIFRVQDLIGGWIGQNGLRVDTGLVGEGAESGNGVVERDVDLHNICHQVFKVSNFFQLVFGLDVVWVGNNHSGHKSTQRHNSVSLSNTQHTRVDVFGSGLEGGVSVGDGATGVVVEMGLNIA
ncbi:hypothetical protein OGATHE_004943 [Ogataea polymorpha]|uniref:Uncharacterized protein n=1 Tax=Ogataea polymorpha TaxID=460523 RepID=A0A9P8NWP5_9ASCO|nr:hypothetical protein OGATHE_004943 [Ogataea polymorpha]